MNDKVTKTDSLDPAAELRTLREQAESDRAALCKWGRVQRALVALLVEKGVISGKQELMDRVYRDIDATSAEGQEEPTVAGDARD